MPDRPQTLSSGPERDEAAGYRPVSAVAVAALMLAVVVACTVVAIGFMARGRPILSPVVLVIAAFGMGLAIYARWHVRRSEGTRTGLGLTRAAVWLSLLSFGGYGAYFAATDLVIRQQARAVADQFIADLVKGQPELAFRLTRDPAQQRGMEEDPKKIRDRFGANDYHQFWQGDLVRTFRTWTDNVRVQYVGPGERVDLPNGFFVQLNYVVRAPEGEWDMDVWARGIDDPTTGGRDWQVLFPKTAFKPGVRLTHLGRICGELQVVWSRVRYLEWSQRLPTAPATEVAGILRIEGNVPPEGQRDKLVQEVKQPRAIVQFPGAGPTRPPGAPTIYFDPAGVRLVQRVQVNAPAVDAQCPAELTVQIVGDDLVKELLKLAGPGWESQPLLPTEDYGTQLVDFKYEFKVTELNLRPSLPRISAPTREQ